MGRKGGEGEEGRNDPNIVCTYKLKKFFKSVNYHRSRKCKKNVS
jgi:hypothetical protein